MTKKNSFHIYSLLLVYHKTALYSWFDISASKAHVGYIIKLFPIVINIFYYFTMHSFVQTILTFFIV